jgi:hypothetical protein
VNRELFDADLPRAATMSDEVDVRPVADTAADVTRLAYVLEGAAG